MEEKAFKTLEFKFLSPGTFPRGILHTFFAASIQKFKTLIAGGMRVCKG